MERPDNTAPNSQQDEGKGKEKAIDQSSEESEGEGTGTDDHGEEDSLLGAGRETSLNSCEGDYGACEPQVVEVNSRTELDWLSCWKVFNLEPYDLLFFAALGGGLGATLSILVFNESTYFDVKEIGAMVVLSMSALTLLALALSRWSSSSSPFPTNSRYVVQCTASP
jgi:hypothetical protein